MYCNKHWLVKFRISSKIQQLIWHMNRMWIFHVMMSHTIPGYLTGGGFQASLFSRAVLQNLKTIIFKNWLNSTDLLYITTIIIWTMNGTVTNIRDIYDLLCLCHIYNRYIDGNILHELKESNPNTRLPVFLNNIKPNCH